MKHVDKNQAQLYQITSAIYKQLNKIVKNKNYKIFYSKALLIDFKEKFVILNYLDKLIISIFHLHYRTIFYKCIQTERNFRRQASQNWKNIVINNVSPNSISNENFNFIFHILRQLVSWVHYPKVKLKLISAKKLKLTYCFDNRIKQHCFDKILQCLEVKKNINIFFHEIENSVHGTILFF